MSEMEAVIMAAVFEEHNFDRFDGTDSTNRYRCN